MMIFCVLLTRVSIVCLMPCPVVPGADGVRVRVGHHLPPGFQREVQAVQGGPNINQIGQKLPSANGLTGERTGNNGEWAASGIGKKKMCPFFVLCPCGAPIGLAGTGQADFRSFPSLATPRRSASCVVVNSWKLGRGKGSRGVNLLPPSGRGRLEGGKGG